MTQPATLLQLAGANTTPNRLSESVLLIIDHQLEYRDGGLPLSGIAPAMTAIRILQARARSLGVPLIHVAHHAQPGAKLFDPESPNAAFLPGIEPRPGEAVVVKAWPSAFTHTRLREALESLGRTRLVVAGFMTHMCVSSTVRVAAEMGYRCTVVASACASRNLPDGTGGLVSAEEVHRVALAALADRFATLVPTPGELLD